MEAGTKLEIEYRVKEADLAKSLSWDPNDDFPEVLATSKMVALMELAAARLMRSLLNPGELSVGVNVNIDHMAATPNAQEVTVVAIYTGMLGKLFGFDVALYDKGGLAGKGQHTRAIVKTERLVHGANKRVGLT